MSFGLKKRKTHKKEKNFLIKKAKSAFRHSSEADFAFTLGQKNFNGNEKH